MQRRTSRSGGIFLTLGILSGFAWGLATDNAMQGVLAGTALGIAAAALLWLVDRRR